jgi:hypothetical protein
MESSIPQASHPFRPDVSFDDKWELLKPDLERLWLNEKRKLPEIIQMMKAQYAFNAQ